MLMLKRMFNESDESVVSRWVENPYWQHFIRGDAFPMPKASLPQRDAFGMGKASPRKDRRLFYSKELTLYKKVLEQTRNSKDKIYPKDSPGTVCMNRIQPVLPKAKPEGPTDSLGDSFGAGKPYEFGSKVVFVRGAKSGVITAACNFSGNPYDGKTPRRDAFPRTSVGTMRSNSDGKTPRRDAFPRESFGLALEATLAQSQRVCNGHRAKVAVTDRGFRGQSKVVDTQIVIPDSPAKIKRQTAYQKRKARKRFRGRAGIEPIIGHLKHDHHMVRNFLIRGIPLEKGRLEMKTIRYWQR